MTTFESQLLFIGLTDLWHHYPLIDWASLCLKKMATRLHTALPLLPPLPRHLHRLPGQTPLAVLYNGNMFMLISQAIPFVSPDSKNNDVPQRDINTKTPKFLKRAAILSSFWEKITSTLVMVYRSRVYYLSKELQILTISFLTCMSLFLHCKEHVTLTWLVRASTPD